MKKIINLCLILLPLNIIAQNTDSIIQQIRSEYKTIVDNKEKYETVRVYPKDLYSVGVDEDGEPYADEPYSVDAKVTYYIDGNAIKLITISTKLALNWVTKFEMVEYYLKNNNVFFMYQQCKKLGFPDDYQWEIRPTCIEEKRAYYDSNQQPVKCLRKIVDGKLSEIDSLLQKTTNEEEDCYPIWRISPSTNDGACIPTWYYFSGSLMETFFEQNNVFQEENINFLFELLLSKINHEKEDN